MSKDGEDITRSLDAAAMDQLSNSLNKANQALILNIKEIKLTGIDAITDTIPGITDKTPYYRTLPLHQHQFKLIKIANPYQIKAMMQIDNKGELTYELAIPLKYIAHTTDAVKTIFYNITIHGRGEDGRPGNTWSYTPPPNSSIIDQDLEEPTDFWGEYTLAKKP